MQQLIFDLYPAAPASFDNFVTGNDAAPSVDHNSEVLAGTRRFINTFIEARAQAQEAIASTTHSVSLLLWGAEGAGKTHLLNAAAVHAASAGVPVHWLTAQNNYPPLPGTRHAVDAAPDTSSAALWLVDDVDTADDALQGFLFTLYNALRENGGILLAAAALPPARLPLREDLRTRLGWGHIYELTTLRDDDKLQALIAHANSRGLRLSEEVVAYLLRHSRRDMRSLVTVLNALDHYSLSLKRPLTLPLVRTWLQEQQQHD